MDILFLLTVFIVSVFVSIMLSPAKAFLNVYLFVLLLTPSQDDVKFIEGIPSISIAQVALFPMLFCALINRINSFSISMTDFFVLGFIGTASISEYIHDGFKVAQNSTYHDICNIALPYVIGKILIESYQLDFKLAKRFVLYMAICSFAMGYEFILGKNLFLQVFWPFFHTVHGVLGVGRYGFTRATGPFAHPIIACIVVVIAFFLHCWLVLNKQWKSIQGTHVKHINFLIDTVKILFQGVFNNIKLLKGTCGISLNNIIFVILLCGMITPLSRGPVLGGLCGLFLFSFVLKRKYISFLRFAIIGVILFSFIYIYNIQDIQETNDTELSGSVYYRSKLVDAYWDQFVATPYFGRGQFNIEIEEHLDSIDNAYLYLAVTHGVYNVAFFTLIFLNIFFKLLWRLRKKMPSAELQLIFTFLSILVMFSISFGTVWMPPDLAAILFLLFGWMEGFLLAKKKPHLKSIPG
jgi:hypothetical protein